MAEQAPWETEAPPEKAPWDTPPPAPEAAKPAMPNALDAMLQGVGSGVRGVQDTLTINSTAAKAPHAESPAAAPFELSDITSPISQGLPKVAYRLGEGAPTLAAGVAGGLGGAAVAGPPGAIAGGAAGAAIGSVAQSLGPIFQEELKRNPNNPDAAWDSTVKQAAAGGLFSAAGWAAFPLRIASGPLKQMMFQTFGVQPGISMAHQATTNVIKGDPVTQNLGEAYTSGAVMTGIPAAGHAAIKAAMGTVTTPPSNLTGPHKAVADRLAESGNPVRFRTFDDAYTNMKDDLHPYKVMENAMKELGQHGDLEAGESPYTLARLSRGSSGKAVHFVDYGTFDYETGNKRGESLRQVLNPVKDNMDAFEVYLASKRAVELEGRGIKTGIPLNEAQAVIQADQARFEPVARRVQKYQDDVLHYLRDSGFLNDEQYQNIKKLNQDYVPFYRLMDEGQSGAGGGGGGLRVKQPIKGIEGSERQIINPIESIIKNTHLFIDLAERNRANRALAELAERTPGHEQFMEKVSSNAPIELSKTEMDRFMTAAGLPGGTPPASFAIFRPKNLSPAPDQIALYRDGKRELWRVPPEVAKAASGMDAQSIGTIQKIIATPAKVLRAGVTLAPDFFVRNMIRDQLTAFAFSKNGYIPLYDFMRGMREVMGAKYGAWLEGRNGSNAALNAISSVLGKGENFKEWMRSGGANAALVSGERDYIANEIRRLADNGSFKDMHGVLTRPLDMLQAVSELMESGTRLGDFMKARASGKSLPQSGFESREVTLDFWRIGAKVRALNNIIAFFNANIEGLDRTARAFKERPAMTTFKVMGSVGLTSALLAWANKDDKRIEELPTWERDFFWHIPTDKWNPINADDAAKTPAHLKRQGEGGQWYRNEGTIFKVPKNFELGLIFGSVPERMFEAFYKENPDAWRNVGKSFQRAFMMEPSTIIPTIAEPVAEQLTNYSFFTERPLVPKAMQEIQPKFQYTPYTTEVAKLVGAGLGKIFDKSSIASPIVIENYVRAWTGSLGMQALRGADEALKKSGLIQTPPEATPTPADKWFQRSFVSRYPSAGAESIQKFYETYGERKVNANTVNFLNKRVGRPDDANAVLAGSPMVKGDQMYNALNNMQKFLRGVQMNKEMSPDEKRRVMDNTYFQMIEIAKAGNQLFRDTKNPAKKPEVAPWENAQ